ncbi:MAG: RidA family protein [Candidatus Krumholzibacteriota bacterium]|nr:RidA family protein [Candidatus Krumholzibacteriota bacterium]
MKQIIRTDKAPAAVGAYSQAVRAGEFLFISGQLGLDPATGTLCEGIAAQVERAMNNIKGIVSASGGGMESIVKVTVLLQSIGDFKAMNEVYSSFFDGDPPARAAFEVAALPLGGLVEIEAVAWLG